MSNNLPVKTDTEGFIAELEVMNLDDLKDKSFLVAASTGDRSEGRSLSTTIRGPYGFYEMCEEVGIMFREHQHHAKVYIAEIDRTKPVKWLDENTTDYIECHYAEIVTEGMLQGAFDKDYTCRANLVASTPQDDPLLANTERKLIEQKEEKDAAEQDAMP